MLFRIIIALAFSIAVARAETTNPPGPGFGGDGSSLTNLNGSAITSGTVPAARGGAGTINGALKANGSGVVSQAACADLSNATTACSTAIGTSGATLPLLSTANIWGATQTIPSIVIPGSAAGTFMMGPGADPVNRIFDVRNTVADAKTSFQFQETDPLVSGGSFHYSLYVGNTMSGSGHRQVFTTQLTSSAANVNDMLASSAAFCKITGGSGNCFGDNPYAWADAGAATTSQVVGAEIDTRVDNASVVSKVGLQIADVATSSGAGTVLDSGLLIGKQPTAVGYKNGITFGYDSTTKFGIYEKLMYAQASAQNLTAIMDFGGLSGTITNGIILPAGSDLSFGSGANPAGGMVESATATNGFRLIFGDGLLRVNNNANTVTLFDISGTTGIEARKDFTITSGTKTGSSAPGFNLTQTWNNAATAFTAANIDITDTASSAFSRLQSWQVGGVDKAYVRKDGWIYASTGYNVTNNAGSYILGASSDAILSRRAAANWRLGAADAASPVAQTLSVQSVVAGTTNTAGVDWTLTGSQGTGTGAGGKIIFKVAPAGLTGSAQNALADALTINADKSVVFASNITIGDAAALIKSSVAMNNGAAAQTGTLTNAPAAGDPTKWIPINDNGTTRYIPAW